MVQDSSGAIDVHELVDSLRTMNLWLNDNQLTALLASLDRDNIGSVSLEELRHFWDQYARWMAGVQVAALQALFQC